MFLSHLVSLKPDEGHKHLRQVITANNWSNEGIKKASWPAVTPQRWRVGGSAVCFSWKEIHSLSLLLTLTQSFMSDDRQQLLSAASCSGRRVAAPQGGDAGNPPPPAPCWPVWKTVSTLQKHEWKTCKTFTVQFYRLLCRFISTAVCRHKTQKTLETKHQENT